MDGSVDLLVTVLKLLTALLALAAAALGFWAVWHKTPRRGDERGGSDQR